MFDFNESIWAGSLASLDAVLRLAAVSDERLAAGVLASEAEQKPYQVVGNVAIVPIRGPLMNRSIPEWARDYATGYPDIRAALIAATKDPQVTKILLDINSGGGAVSGVDETASLISKIHAEHKPVSAFGDIMASAAYWLGSAAGKVSSTRTGVIGSIGVISTHMEYTKMLQESGISATVFRAGKFKALGQPVEPLTEAAREQIQARLDTTYSMFIDHVAAQRGVTYAVADQQMGQGKEFVGQAALTAGLIDAVSTFDDVLASLQDQSVSSVRFNPRTQQMNTRATLTEAQLAAVQEGAALPAASSAPAEPAVPVTAPAAEAKPADSVEVAPAAATTEAKPEATPAGDNTLVAYLRGELTETREKLTQSAAQLALVQENLRVAQTTVEPMTEIARDSVARMRVALSMAAIDVSALKGEQLLAEHKSLSEQFVKTFKGGGVAAVAVEQKDTVKAARPINQAAIAAVRISK